MTLKKSEYPKILEVSTIDDLKVFHRELIKGRSGEINFNSRFTDKNYKIDEGIIKRKDLKEYSFLEGLYIMTPKWIFYVITIILLIGNILLQLYLSKCK